MADQNIGAARVHLLVDTSNWDSALAQARDSAATFGSNAQAAFDKSSEGVRRATNRIADYIAALKSTDGPMERQLRQLARLGADDSIVRALRDSWAAVNAEVQSTNDALQEAARINAALDSARGQSFRQNFEASLGIGSTDAAAQARRRADAEAAILPMLQQQERQYEAIYSEALRINQARDEHIRLMSQQDINSTLGVGDGRSGAYLAEQQRVVASLTQQFNQMDAAIDQAFAQNADIERFRQQLENVQKAAGKTHYEMLQMKADQLGVGSSFKPLIDGIKEQDAAMGHAGLTAKQYAWAMRGLPAQLTDISVGLATGQKPWMVFLQQGGQLKDIFGGIGPAAKAVGSAVWAMVTPWTVAAAAIGAGALAAFNASRDMEALAVATAKADGVAGSATQLHGLVDSLNRLEGINLGAAEGAVARLASGGKLVGENLHLASEAAARWATVSGESADVIASKFEAIAKDPLEAIRSGQIRVTEEQYRSVQASIRQGDHQQAVNDLTRIYYDTVLGNAASVESHTNSLSKLWRDTKDEISTATGELGKFINMLSTVLGTKIDAGFGTSGGLGNALRSLLPSERLRMLTGAYGRAMESAGIYGAPYAEQNGSMYDPAQAERDERRNAALASWSATADQAAQRQITLNKLRKEGLELGQDEATVNAVIARQEKQWAEQDAKRASGGRRTSQGRDGTQAIRDAAAAEIAAITTQTRLLQSQYDQRQITVEEYYGMLRGYADQELAATMRSIDAQRAAVAGRADAATRLEQLESQAARAREQNSQRTIELSEGERKAIQQREIAYRDYVRALDDAVAATQREADLEVARVSMGSKQYERMVAQNELLRRRAELEAELSRRVSDGGLNAKDAERYRDALEKVNEQLRAMVEGFVRVDEAQGSFLAGSQSAWQDWLNDTKDVASHGAGIMKSALDGFVDATTDAIMGNLDSFESFFDSLHRQILRFIVQQQLTKWLESLGDSANSASSSGGNSFFCKILKGIGSIFGGATKNAKGAVYATPGLSAYRNTVVSSPTIFPFARGGVPNIGLMGERSGMPYEAIMPLTRTAGGELGVRTTGGSGNVINNTTNVNVQPTMDSRTAYQVAKRVGTETQRVLARR